MKTLVKTNGNLFRSMPFFDDFFMRDWPDASNLNWKTSGTSVPAVNVMETNDDFNIQVAAPGLKRDDFKVELDNNILTISSAEKKSREENSNDGTYTRKEFSYQNFQRSFTLPENKVEGEKISARYSDGILHITIPKKEEAKVKPVKQISVV